MTKMTAKAMGSALRKRLLVIVCALVLIGVFTLGIAHATQATTDDGTVNTPSLCTANTPIDVDSAKTVNSQLARIPEWMLTEFSCSGWTIQVTDADLKTMYPELESLHKVAGVTDPASRNITIANTSPNVTLHEMGHWLDLYWDSPSTSPEFEELIESSNHILLALIVDPYPTTRQELFADAFTVYINLRPVFAFTAPELCTYMANLVDPPESV